MKKVYRVVAIMIALVLGTVAPILAFGNALDTGGGYFQEAENIVSEQEITDEGISGEIPADVGYSEETGDSGEGFAGDLSETPPVNEYEGEIVNSESETSPEIPVEAPIEPQLDFPTEPEADPGFTIEPPEASSQDILEENPVKLEPHLSRMVVSADDGLRLKYTVWFESDAEKMRLAETGLTAVFQGQEWDKELSAWNLTKIVPEDETWYDTIKGLEILYDWQIYDSAVVWIPQEEQPDPFVYYIKVSDPNIELDALAPVQFLAGTELLTPMYEGAWQNTELLSTLIDIPQEEAPNQMMDTVNENQTLDPVNESISDDVSNENSDTSESDTETSDSDEQMSPEDNSAEPENETELPGNTAVPDSDVDVGGNSEMPEPEENPDAPEAVDDGSEISDPAAEPSPDEEPEAGNDISPQEEPSLEECTCVVHCTEQPSVDICPVCGAEGADWENVCQGVNLLSVRSESSDLSHFLSGVTITCEDGKEFDGTLYVGQQYKVTLVFTEGGVQGDQFSASGSLTYQIPEGLDVSAFSGQELTVTYGGEEIHFGTYSVNDEGLLTVELTPEGIELIGRAHDLTIGFQLTGEMKGLPDPGDDQLNFGENDGDYGFTVVDKPQISVDKFGKYTFSGDATGNVVDYTVNAEVINGPITKFSFNDLPKAPEAGNVTINLNKDSFVVSIKTPKLESDGSYSKDELGNTIYESRIVAPSKYSIIYDGTDPNEFTVTLNETVNTDEVVELTYKIDVSIIDTTSSSFNDLYNTVTVTAEKPGDPSSPEENTVTEKCDNSIETYYYRKSAGVAIVKTQSYDEITRRMHYKLDISVSKGYYSKLSVGDQMNTVIDGVRYYVCSKKYILNEHIYVEEYDTTGSKKYEVNILESSPDGSDNFIRDHNGVRRYLYHAASALRLGEDDTFNTDKDIRILYEYDIDLSGDIELHISSTDAAVDKVVSGIDLLKYGLVNHADVNNNRAHSFDTVMYSTTEKMLKQGLTTADGSIDYTVTLNLSDSDIISYFHKNDDDIYFVDDFDPGFEYVPDSLRADVIGEGEDSYIDNYSFTGTLSINSDTSSFSANLNDFKINGHSSIQSLKEVLEDAEIYSDMREKIVFYYSLKPTEDWKNEHAHESGMIVSNSACISDSIISQRWSVDDDTIYTLPRMTKKAEQVGNSNLMHFSLTINPQGLALSPGGEKLIIVDISKNLQIRKDTIKVTDSSDTEVDYEILDEIFTDDLHELTLQVQDGEPLKVEYDALVTKKGADVLVSNTANLQGVGDSEGVFENHIRVDQIYGGGVGDPHELTIEKVDSVNPGKGLEGAEFDFYIILKEGSTLDQTGTIGGYKVYSESDWKVVTNRRGLFKITKDMDWDLEPDNYYILQETKAPTGYKKLDDPIVFYYGEEENMDTVKYPGAEFVLPNGTITIQNEANPEGSLTISKKVTGDGDTEKEWNFELSGKDVPVTGQCNYSKSKADGTKEEDILEFNDNKVAFTLKHGESITLTGLPLGEYTLHEKEENQDGYTTSYTVESEPGNTVSVTAGSSKSIEVVNDLKSDAGFVLPDTGGSGRKYGLALALFITGLILTVCTGSLKRRPRL